MTASVLILIGSIFVLAMLYSSVGHAGASGYLAAMAIVMTTMDQHDMKVIALTLNIFVGTIGAYRFARAGHFHWRTFWPFGLVAVPMSFLGGRWELPGIVFKPLIGVVLLFAAVILIVRALRSSSSASPAGDSAHEKSVEPTMPPIPAAVGAGAVLGLLSGLTGTGGGIFLSPLLLLGGWASPKRTAAVSVVFVLLNSIAGLAGRLSDIPDMPSEIGWYIVAAVFGGILGSGIGASRRTSGEVIRGLLGVVLLIAAAKMFITVFDADHQNVELQSHVYRDAGTPTIPSDVVAKAKSFSVSPPASWVERVRVTLL